MVLMYTPCDAKHFHLGDKLFAYALPLLFLPRDAAKMPLVVSVYLVGCSVLEHLARGRERDEWVEADECETFMNSALRIGFC